MNVEQCKFNKEPDHTRAHNKKKEGGRGDFCMYKADIAMKAFKVCFVGI